MHGRLIIDALQTAALRALSLGEIPASALAVVTVAYPRYTNKQLAQIMRQLANVLDKEIDGEE